MREWNINLERRVRDNQVVKVICLKTDFFEYSWIMEYEIIHLAKTNNLLDKFSWINMETFLGGMNELWKLLLSCKYLFVNGKKKYISAILGASATVQTFKLNSPKVSICNTRKFSHASMRLTRKFSLVKRKIWVG